MRSADLHIVVEFITFGGGYYVCTFVCIYMPTLLLLSHLLVLIRPEDLKVILRLLYLCLIFISKSL